MTPWLVWSTAHVHGETGPMKGLLPTPYWWVAKIRSSKSPDPNLLLTLNSCAQECDTAVCGFFFFPLANRIKPVFRNFPSNSGCFWATNFSLLVLYGLTRATSRTIAARLATCGLSDFAIRSRCTTFFSEMCDCSRNANISSLSSMAWRSLFGLALQRLHTWIL